MKRRVFLCGSLAVGVTALSPTLISLAAEKLPAPGTITTVAGTGEPGFSGDNGPATQAQLDAPSGIAIDAAGNVYFADQVNGNVQDAVLSLNFFGDLLRLGLAPRTRGLSCPS